MMQQITEEVDWAVAAQSMVRLLIPHVVIYSLLKALEPWRKEALELGLSFRIRGERYQITDNLSWEAVTIIHSQTVVWSGASL